MLFVSQKSMKVQTSVLILTSHLFPLATQLLVFMVEVSFITDVMDCKYLLFFSISLNPQRTKTSSFLYFCPPLGYCALVQFSWGIVVDFPKEGNGTVFLHRLEYPFSGSLERCCSVLHK